MMSVLKLVERVSQHIIRDNVAVGRSVADFDYHFGNEWCDAYPHQININVAVDVAEDVLSFMATTTPSPLLKRWS